MSRVAILGAGELGAALAHYSLAIGTLEVVGFFDDTFHSKGETVEPSSGLPILGPIDEARNRHELGDFDGLLMGIGYKHLSARQRVYENLKDLGFCSLVHPAALIDPSAIIEPGAVIYSGCVVDARARIGANSLLNVGCIVAHDTVVESHSFLGPGVTLAGCTRIGQRCFIGVGTTVVDNLTIADDVQTGGGTVVIKDLDAGLWVGNPARKIR